MGIPVILEASLLLHLAAVPPSLQAVDRIRHLINTSEETVRLNRYTEKRWRRTKELMHISDVPSAAAAAALRCRPHAFLARYDTLWARAPTAQVIWH
jgi:hypothetical protein